MTPAARVPLLLFVGCLLVQTAWALALPPFRGTDEFDHAYRAAAVAGGQWRPSGTAVDASAGRGQLVTVPGDLVAAAGPVCAALPYTGPANCAPVADLGDGRVQVASAAATYNPVFYWVVGAPSSWWSGAGSLYAMRVTAALLCAALVALAGWMTLAWARTAWPFAAMAAAVTPVMAFSMSVAAPNGLEMCAGLVVWSALLGLRSAEVTELHGLRILVVASVGACVLVTTRTLGPLWLVLIGLSVLVLVGPGRVLGLLRRRPFAAAGCSLTVLVCTLAAVGWTLTASTNALEPFPTKVPNVLTGTLQQLPLWFLQSIAAFPRRIDPAPPLVYVLVAVTGAALLGAGVAVASRRVRVAMLLVLIAAVGIPVLVTVPTIREAGAIWQGRYGLPFHLGLTLLAGTALDARPGGRTLVAPRILGGVLLAAAHLVAVVAVLERERRTSALAGSGSWLEVPTWSVAALLLLGFAAWAWVWRLVSGTATPPVASATVTA